MEPILRKPMSGLKVLGRVDIGNDMMLPKVIETLSALGEDLSRLPTATEAEFLTIGSSLQLFFEKSSKISSLSADAASKLAGDELTRNMDDAVSLLSRMRVYIDDAAEGTERRIEKLKSVLATVKRLEKQMGNFAQLSKHLRIIGVTARIYSQGGAGSDGERVLADNIRLLSARISSGAEQAASDLGHVIALIDDAVQKIRDIKDSEYGQMRSALRQMNAGMTALRGRHASSRGMFTEISAISRAVSRDIEDVVMAAQYQDITRQKFQMAGQTMHSLCEIILEMSEDDIRMETDNFQKTAALVCERIVANLLDARVSFTDAVENIMDSLNDVASVISVLSANMHDMTAADGAVERTFLQDIGDNLASVNSALSGVHEAETNAASAIAEAGNALLKISSLIEEIDGIGDSVAIVAMNAAVRSAQSNGRGSAMKVLSGAIHRLSGDSSANVCEATADLNTLSSDIAELLSVVTKELNKTLDNTQKMEREMSSLVDSLGGINGDVSAVLREMDQEVCQLSTSIRGIVENTNCHHRVDKVVGAVVSGLSKIASQWGALLSQSFYGTPGQGPQHSYGGTYAVAEPKIEYASDGRDSGSEFGDNIELFE